MARNENEDEGEGSPDAAPVDTAPPDTEPATTSVSKARAGGQDSRAVAHVGEDRDAPSTRISEGRGVAERIAEHERKIQHKDLTDAEVDLFLNPRRKRPE